ncbi:MAG: toxin-antitoxin system TumE family protein [Nitrospirota bacterium]
MLLSEYLTWIADTIEEYSKTDLIVHSDIRSDIRTSKIGIISGSLVFVDDSKLFFMEYLDVRYKPQKLSYSFHYQSKDDELIFRYDNAEHKPKLAFVGHKHLRGGSIIETETPDLAIVLEEIINAFL